MKLLSFLLLAAAAALTFLSGCATDDDSPHHLTARQEAMTHGAYDPTGRLSTGGY